MARQLGFANAFNAGELGEAFWARGDLEAWVKGCALGRNFVGLTSGPLARRAGFWDAGAAADEDPDHAVRLIPFKRSIDDALMLEFSDEIMRVWNADYTPVMSGMSVLEVVSPWTHAQLAGLYYIQSGDVIIFCHADGLKPKSLTRNSATSWTFADYAFVDGPWRPENTDTAVTVKYHRTGGTSGVEVGSTGTLTANTAIFAAGMVGTYFKLRDTPGGHVIDAWAAGATNPNDWASNSLALSNGRIYKQTSGASKTKTGYNQPIHEEGEVSDGNVDWTYVHDGAGIVKVTGYTSTTVLAVEVIRTLPNADNEYTSYWAEAAYSDYRGWPRAVPTIREERAIFGGAAGEPDKMRASRTAGFKPTSVDMKPGLGTGRVVDDDAVTRRVGDDGAGLVWLMSSTFLIAGSRSAERVVAGATLDDPLTPAGNTEKNISDYGSEPIQPVKAHRSVLFVARGGETLRSVAVSLDAGIEARDLSVLAPHIGELGLAEIAWTAQPDNLLWARTGDGGLASFAYHPQESVYGWNRHAVAGDADGASDWTVESLAVIPGYGSRDALWIVARREKGEATQRRIMVMSRRADRMRYDAARLYDGAAVNVIDGLDHLAGETVGAMAQGPDGTLIEFEGLEVSEDGEITLPGGREESYVWVGLPYVSRFESLPLGEEGKSRPTQAWVTAIGWEYLYGPKGPGRLERAAVPREAGETAYSEDKRNSQKVTFTAGADTAPQIVVQIGTGRDLTVCSVRPRAEVEG